MYFFEGMNLGEHTSSQRGEIAQSLVTLKSYSIWTLTPIDFYPQTGLAAWKCMPLVR